MSLSVARHSTRTGVALNTISQAQPQTPANSATRVLGSMYQRIPGELLAKMHHRRPLNYAILEEQEVPARPGTAVCPLGRSNAFSRWKVHPLTSSVDFRHSLVILEEANAANRGAIRIQLNFTDGTHATFARTDPSNPQTLRCVSLYDPSEVFCNKTVQKNTTARAFMAKKLRFISDDCGRSLNAADAPRPRTSSPFHRDNLYRDCPAPTTGRVGYQFTPMSYISFLVRPNSLVAGCRPKIRETNPQAVHYRPRPLHNPPAFLSTQVIDGRNSISPLRANRAPTAPTGNAEAAGSAEAPMKLPPIEAPQQRDQALPAQGTTEEPAK